MSLLVCLVGIVEFSLSPPHCLSLVLFKEKLILNQIREKTVALCSLEQNSLAHFKLATSVRTKRPSDCMFTSNSHITPPFFTKEFDQINDQKISRKYI